MIGVDVGGTFTDVVAIENGQIKTVKVATDVRTTERGVLQGAEEIGVAAAEVFNHASTHGLNAIITRRLPKIAFLTTMGHRDILDVGRTWRPIEGLMNPKWRRSYGDANRPLVPRYLRRGIRERLTADGGVLIPLDEEQTRAELAVLRRCGVEESRSASSTPTSTTTTRSGCGSSCTRSSATSRCRSPARCRRWRRSSRGRRPP
ncbi:hydantoinase/oxoprolinase N-terminal domain-containing protein [Prauserella oleivorans]